MYKLTHVLSKYLTLRKLRNIGKISKNKFQVSLAQVKPWQLSKLLSWFSLILLDFYTLAVVLNPLMNGGNEKVTHT